VYDVVVTDADGRRIALFRGKSHRVSGQVVPTDAVSTAAVSTAA